MRALLVPAEAEGHQWPAVWKALPTASLHLNRVCGLCHHPPPSNSGNVSGYHLAASNKTGCWSSVVSFVASFYQSNFAILAICPHTLAGCVL